MLSVIILSLSVNAVDIGCTVFKVISTVSRQFLKLALLCTAKEWTFYKRQSADKGLNILNNYKLCCYRMCAALPLIHLVSMYSNELTL